MSDGTNDTINEKGIDYYNRLIDAMVAENIVPMATLYHWDLPQHLQNLRGWEDEMIIEHFKNYADLCYREFGDRVSLL